jgi:hypothetical protein
MLNRRDCLFAFNGDDNVRALRLLCVAPGMRYLFNALVNPLIHGARHLLLYP